MKCRMELFVAILVYVTLDLALPAMPGAFVFEPADSVESVGGGRPAMRGVVLPTPVAGPTPVAPLLVNDAPHRWPGRGEPAVPSGTSLHHLARGRGEPAQPSEDPH
jgi:hypothetical protein